MPIGRVDAAAARARPTGMDELDRVLGGGLVPGAVVLLAGEPGVGKSTLLLEAGALAAAHGRVLYVTGEESAAQVRLRADRIGAVSDALYLAAETDFGALLGHVQAVEPSLLIVDSVQTISAAGIDGVPGGVTQVREITAALTALAKQRSLSTMLVGHVTKDGSVAGPRTLEHLVDVVLHFEGDPRGQLRMVRAVKNRFGPTDEVGCFELGEFGLIGLPDPSGLFLSQRHDPVPGTCVTVTLEGRRPLVAEVQTLVCEVTAEPRRVTSGLDSARVGMLIAVLQRRAHLGIARVRRLRGHRRRGPADRAIRRPGGGTRDRECAQQRQHPRRPRRHRRGRARGRDPAGGGDTAAGRRGRADGLQAGDRAGWL